MNTIKTNNKDMNNKSLFRTMTLMATMAMTLASCNNTSPAMDSQPTASGTASGTGMKIAYVEVDSLMSQYQFCKDFTLILQKKSNNMRSTLSSKEQKVQQAYNNFQEKAENNGFTSREQAEREQAAIQKSAQDLQELNNRLALELQSETDTYNQALRDSLQHFLDIYNKEKHFDLILAKAGDNILYANKVYDITNDVINGLNKRYKPAPEKK